MAKSKERIQARTLRSQGNSIKEIARKLNVSPGSASVWCRDIVLSDEQIATLEKRMRDPNYGKRAQYLQKVKQQRKENIETLRKEGFSEIGNLSDREFFIAGVALYWAEGFKKDKQLGFANVDPKMITFFISWLKKCLSIREKDIKLRVTVNERYIAKIKEIESYWSQLTGMPLLNFQKPIVQRVKWKKEYENKNEYKGVLRIRVSKSLSHLRKMFGMIEGLYSNSQSY